MLADLKNTFLRTTKLVLKEKISTNIETLERQKLEIIQAYNSTVDYIKTRYEIVNEEDKKRYKEELAHIRKKLNDCIQKFESNYVLPTNIFDPVKNNDIIIANSLIEKIMALSIPDFLKTASGHLNKIYSGDPLGLPSFIDSITLLESLATTNELKTFFVSFIRTKIDGKAREYLLDSDNTAEKIIQCLKNNIKPECSKVIQGRLTSLKFNHNSPQEFADKAENLADALRRSLIVEGITPQKATEMSIDKMIDLCRANARSDLVKSVLEASSFESPKEVIAKFITQTDKSRSEHQILSFQKYIHSKNHNNRKFTSNTNSSKFNHNNRNNDRNRHHSHNNNQSNGSSNRPHNQHGQSNRNFYNNRNNNRPNNGSSSNIRVFSNSGNEVNPQSTAMGASNNPANAEY